MNDDDAAPPPVELVRWLVGDSAELPPRLTPADLRAGDEQRLEWRNDEGQDPLVTALTYVRDQAPALRDAWAAVRRYDALTPAHAESLLDMVSEALARSWRFHLEVRQALWIPHTRDALEQLVQRSWSMCMSWLLLLSIGQACRDDEGTHTYDRVTQHTVGPAEHYAYAASLQGGGGDNIIMSDAPLVQYSVGTWQTAVVVFLDRVLGVTGWTPGADAYWTALLQRYAMLLTQVDEEPASMYDVPGLCDVERGRPTRLLALHEERRLVPLMRTFQAARRWYLTAEEPPPRVPPAQRRRRMAAWCAFAHSVAGDDRLHHEVGNRVADLFMRRTLRPGELAAVAYSEASAKVDAETVLFVERQDDFVTTQTMQQKLSVAQIVDAWLAASSASAAAEEEEEEEDWETTAARRSSLEPLALLVFETCLDVWLQLTGVSARFSFRAQAYLDDHSLEPPYDVPPLNPAAARAACNDMTPVFVVVARVYNVVRADAVSTTPHLIDALDVWLAAALRERRFARADVHNCLLTDFNQNM